MVFTGLAVRLLALTVAGAYHIPSDQDHFAFGAEMGRIARSLVTGRGFSSPFHEPSGPTAIVAPVYPLLLATAFKVFGTYSQASAWVMLSLNSVFSALTCLPIFALGRRVFGQTVGVWAGWTWAFFPYAVYWPNRWVWDTSLTTFLLALVLLVTVSVQDSPHVSRWLRLGLLWALAVLTNTTVASLFSFALGWLCGRRRMAWVTWGRLATAALLAFALGLMPWVARNKLVFGHFVLRSNLGLELIQGNHPGATGLRDWQLGPAFNPAEMKKYRLIGELPYMAEKRREAWLFISSHPGTFAMLVLRRIAYFWTGTGEIVLPGHLLESLAFYTLVSVLAIAGLVAAFKKRVPEAWLLAVVLAIFPLPYYLTHPEPRFRHLIEPELLLLATYYIACLRPTHRLPAG